MAIDRGPWNALVDDDGSNLIGSVWNKAAIKTVLLDPTDAAILPIVYGTWTPTDASGAGLVLATARGVSAKYGRIVAVWAQIVYPSTANGAVAVLGGLPHLVRVPVGAWQGFGIQRVWYMQEATATLAPFSATTGGQHINSQLSGTNNIISAVYLTD